MIGSIRKLLEHRHSVRAIGIAIAVLMTASLASIGPVGDRSKPDPNRGFDDPIAGGDLPGTATPSLIASGLPSPTGSASTIGSTTGGTGGIGATTGGSPSIPPSGVPRFGLRFQGVHQDYVKVGWSYNTSLCGDAAVLNAMFGAATGDYKKSIETYARYINDTGGIGGREYRPIIVDDGGTCTAQNIAGAIKLLDEEKVFLAVPGLHTVSDYLIQRKLPVFGGRDDPDSLKKYGPNGLHVFTPAVQTFEAWASFGRYYLDSLAPPQELDGTSAQPKCLVRIENGAAGDFDTAEKILRTKMSKYAIPFRKTFVFKDDVSTAQQQSDAIMQKAHELKCEQIWFMAGNPVGLVFMTDSAQQRGYSPRWTFTSSTALSDDDDIAKLMHQTQWENAIGLSPRVPAGEHPYSGNCKKIYEDYNGNDGFSSSASAVIACAQVLTTAEMMRRAIKLTGVLNADTLLLGADGIDNDFFYDGTVPMDFKFPDADGPFRTRGFADYTVVDWSSDAKRYTFPKYPCYYESFGPNNAGCKDLRRLYQK